jgi:hypothetical protein
MWIKVSVSPVVAMREYVFTLLQTRRHEEALAYCEQALTRDKHDVIFMLYKVDALFCLERVAESAEAAKYLLSLIDAVESADISLHTTESSSGVSFHSGQFTSFVFGTDIIHIGGHNDTLFSATGRKILKVCTCNPLK